MHATCPLCRLSLLSSHKSQNDSPDVPGELSHASSVAEDNVLSLALTPQACEAEATQLSGLRNGEPRTVQNSSEDDARGSQCVDSTRELRDARIKNEVYEHTGGSSGNCDSLISLIGVFSHLLRPFSEQFDKRRIFFF